MQTLTSPLHYFRQFCLNRLSLAPEILSFFILAGSLAVSFTSWHLTFQHERHSNELEFIHFADQYQQQLDRRLENYGQLLLDLRGLFAAGFQAGPNDIETFINSSEITRRYPGISRIGFAQHPVIDDARTTAINGIADAGLDVPGFYVQSVSLDHEALQAHGAVDAGNTGFQNRPDASERSARMAAMAEARDFDRPVATSRLNASRAGHQPGFTIFVPVYHKNLPHETVAERRRNLRGFVYATFVVKDLMQGALDEEMNDQVHLRLYDGDKADPAALIYDNGDQKLPPGHLQYTVTQPITSHDWTLSLSPSSAFQGKTLSSLSSVILAGGIVISFLLFTISSQLLSRRRLLRNREEESLMYRSLFEHNPDCVYSFDLNGHFISGNASTLKLLGFSMEALKQVSFRDVVVAERLEESSWRFQNALKGIASSGETTILNGNGQRVDLGVTNLPIIVDNEVVGVFGIVKDITTKKLTEQALRLAHDELEARVIERTVELEREVAIRKASEADFRSIFEQAALGIAHTSLEGTYIRVNHKYAAILGYTVEELVGKQFLDFTHIDDQDQNRLLLDRLLSGEVTSFALEKRQIRRDGSVAWVNVTVSLTFDATGRIPSHTIAIIEDITESKKIAEALRLSESNLARTQKLVRLGSWIWDVAWNHLSYSDETYRIFQRSPDEMGDTSQAFMAHVHPDDRKTLQHAMHLAVAGIAPLGLDYRILLPDGSVRHVRADSELISSDGAPIVIRGSLQDITERKEQEEALRAMARHLQTVREEERTRIAREIHDDLGGALAAIKFELSAPARHDDADQEGCGRRSQKTIHLIDAAVISLRRIMADLRPSVLDDLGIWAALEWQVREFAGHTSIPCRYRLHGEELALDSLQSTAIFRIIQEALNNVFKHAAATRVKVTAIVLANEILFVVRDNGRGICPTKKSHVHSFGIRGMRERAQSCNGTVKIWGGHTCGTTVVMRFPRKG